MTHESRIQEIKDRKHDAYMHKFHLIDLLRMSKYTFAQKQAQNFENYKYTFNMTQFLYKNGLYIVIIMIFIALCIITPFVKNTQLLQPQTSLTFCSRLHRECSLHLGCRSDPSDRYRPFCRTYGWYGYGYSNHYHA